VTYGAPAQCASAIANAPEDFWMIEAISRNEARLVRMAWATVILVALMAAPVRYAHAQATATPKKESSVTVYGGYRFGGTLTEETTNSTINLDSGSSYALAIDIGLDAQTQLEFFYSQQKTALTSGAFSSTVNNIPLTLYNYQLGGTYFIEQVGRGLYVVGGIGATNVKPDQAGLNSETYFSGNLGVGWMIPIGQHVGIRLEARGYGILLNNDSSMFCGSNTGCTVAIKGSALYEGEVLVGLSIRF
jgi:hypothetical protein